MSDNDTSSQEVMDYFDALQNRWLDHGMWLIAYPTLIPRPVRKKFVQGVTKIKKGDTKVDESEKEAIDFVRDQIVSEFEESVREREKNEGLPENNQFRLTNMEKDTISMFVMHMLRKELRWKSEGYFHKACEEPLADGV